MERPHANAAPRHRDLYSKGARAESPDAGVLVAEWRGPRPRSEAVLEARRLKKSRAAYGSWPYYWRLLQATVTVRAIHDSEVLVFKRRNSRQLEAPTSNEVSASALPVAADEPQLEWCNLDGTPIYQHHGPKCHTSVLV